MKYAVIVIRTLLGLMFVVFGSNYFLHFIDMSEAAKNFKPESLSYMEILGNHGYMTVVKILEITGGILVLSGRFVPLGLTLLGPIIVNILLFHLCLERKPEPMAFLPLVFLVVLIAAYWGSFKGVFAANPSYCGK